jgi:phosphatidylserine/phosphatidylglycerophosphate/cardiolipin synthase-like enzyme
MASTATVNDVVFGTGHHLYRTALLPALEAAQREVILITCFWARSPTLDALGASLLALNQRAVESGRRVRVRIGFSSTSVVQKLLSRGRPRRYSRREWHEILGLPRNLADLPGLDVCVTSIFFLPFSVWHPKFVIVDRRTVFLPSCNVSWEEWFEVCVSFRGPIVQEFVKFWTTYWHDGSGSNAATVMDELLINSDSESAQDSMKVTNFHHTLSMNAYSIDHVFNIVSISSITTLPQSSFPPTMASTCGPTANTSKHEAFGALRHGA